MADANVTTPEKTSGNPKAASKAKPKGNPKGEPVKDAKGNILMYVRK